jgi:hypothetical protein
MGYVRPEEASVNDDASSSSSASSTTATMINGRPRLTPKIGDLVRYYELDGGDRRGEELVGKITFLIQRPHTYVAEITQLEDVGEGYFAEFSSTKRMSKKKDRDITQVSPLTSSFVRSEQAFKVPFDAVTGRVKVRQEQYDLDGWEGPQAVPINQDIVQADEVLYAQLKTKLLKDAAIAGLAGSVLVNILKGSEDAIIYSFRQDRYTGQSESKTWKQREQPTIRHASLGRCRSGTLQSVLGGREPLGGRDQSYGSSDRRTIWGRCSRILDVSNPTLCGTNSRCLEGFW